MSMNALPPVRDASDGFWRRPLVIRFENRFEGGADDKNLAEKLKAELPGIARWAIEGGMRLIANGTYTEPETSRKELRTWRDEASSVRQFIASHIEATPAEKLRASEFYKLYQSWCRDHGHQPKSYTSFGAEASSMCSRKEDRLGRYYEVRLVRDWRLIADDNVDHIVATLEGGAVVPFPADLRARLTALIAPYTRPDSQELRRFSGDMWTEAHEEACAAHQALEAGNIHQAMSHLLWLEVAPRSRESRTLGIEPPSPMPLPEAFNLLNLEIAR